MADIDYRKLLKMCMASWLESEGCFWEGQEGYDKEGQEIKTLSDEELLVIKEIAKEVIKESPDYGAYDLED